MPNTNGIDFIEFLKRNKNTKKIPIIFFTASSSFEDELKAYELGAMDYIVKSISPEVLDAKLTTYITILKKQKNNLVLLEENKHKLIQQSRIATIGEIVNTLIQKCKQSIDIISATNSNLRFKLETNNIDKDFIYRKLNKVDNYIYKMSKNITNITDFSINEKKKKNVILSETMERAISILNPILSFQKIQISTNYNTNKGINIYNNDILQVFLNIIKNSIDAFIRRNIINPIITILIEEKQDSQIISIMDNAGGINEQVKDKVFNPFFSTKNQHQDSGLGLYVSKIILEKNCAGEINFDNTNKGVCFKIRVKSCEAI